MKIATHVLLFGQDKWIMKNVENSYPHVDKIYIAYSELPWGYNPDARKEYKNRFDLNIIKNSKFVDKIHIIEGDWYREEYQRNECVNQAKKDGMNYLMIQDADEFYFKIDFEKIKKFIKNNPNFDVYKCPWVCFWKFPNYHLIDNNESHITGYPQIIINLDNDVSFGQKREPTSKNIVVINDVLCYHMSYVINDHELKEKINTWGHYNDFDIEMWYNDIWLKWDETKTDLHPFNPSGWYKAVKNNFILPEVLQ